MTPRRHLTRRRRDVGGPGGREVRSARTASQTVRAGLLHRPDPSSPATPPATSFSPTRADDRLGRSGCTWPRPRMPATRGARDAALGDGCGATRPAARGARRGHSALVHADRGGDDPDASNVSFRAGRTAAGAGRPRSRISDAPRERPATSDRAASPRSTATTARSTSRAPADDRRLGRRVGSRAPAGPGSTSALSARRASRPAARRRGRSGTRRPRPAGSRPPVAGSGWPSLKRVVAAMVPRRAANRSATIGISATRNITRSKTPTAAAMTLRAGQLAISTVGDEREGAGDNVRSRAAAKATAGPCSTSAGRRWLVRRGCHAAAATAAVPNHRGDRREAACRRVDAGGEGMARPPRRGSCPAARRRSRSRS